MSEQKDQTKDKDRKRDLFKKMMGEIEKKKDDNEQQELNQQTEEEPQQKMSVEDKQKKDPQPPAEDQHDQSIEVAKRKTKQSATGASALTKYKKKPKYETHVPHNIRIPKEMRQDMENIAKKLGIPLGKNTGFFQEFTIDALRPAIEAAKKELGIK